MRLLSRENKEFNMQNTASGKNGWQILLSGSDVYTPAEGHR